MENKIETLSPTVKNEVLKIENRMFWIRIFSSSMLVFSIKNKKMFNPSKKNHAI